MFEIFAGSIPRSGTFFHYSFKFLVKEHILSLQFSVSGERMSTEYSCLPKVWLGSTSHSYMTSDVKQEINQKAFTLPHSFIVCLFDS